MAFAVLASCKRKYEEGPLISFTSKCKRLERTWTLSYIYIDGIDSTEAVYKALGIIDNKFRAKFIEPSDGTCFNYAPIDVRVNITGSIYYSHLPGSYKLSENGKYLIMNIIRTSDIVNLKYKEVGPFFTDDYVEYRIKRLTKSELWLELTYNGKYIWIHFKS